MAKKKSSFYHLRWHKIGINEHVAAEALGVTVDEILQWDDSGAPDLAERYLLLWSKKHLGDEWQGWTLSRGKLRHKGLMFGPNTLLMNRADAEKTLMLEFEVLRLKTYKGVFCTFYLLIINSFRKSAASGFATRAQNSMTSISSRGPLMRG